MILLGRKNAIFDYTPFRTIIADKDKFIAKVFYDFAGKVIRVEASWRYAV